MKRIFTLLLFLLQAGYLQAQLAQPFTESAAPKAKMADASVRKFVSFRFNEEAFKQLEPAIPHLANIHALRNSNALIDLPLADGKQQRFFIAEINTLSEATARLFPQIKTYDVLSIDGAITGRVTSSPMALNVMLLSPEGRQYIMPSSPSDAIHIAYYKKDYDVASLNVRCGLSDLEETSKELKLKTTAALGDCMLRTYNFAVAATGEFTTLLGSQANAVASITSTVANVNLIYERDLGIHLSLVTNNSVIFTNSGTDPFPTVSFPTQILLDDNTNTLDANIGSASYDLGMVFNNGWNGGLAYNPGICNSFLKGGGAAGINGAPYGSVMENVVAHEVGHLFSADHTMSAGTGTLCIDNLNLPTAYEIGGGSTIMAYAGSVCSGLSYQNNTDDYFHYNSVATIRLYSQLLTTCGSTANANNTAPTLSVAPSSYTIPVSTPFELAATGADANGNTLTYTFEQYDAAPTPMTTPPPSTATTGPMFRSYPPTTSSMRQFPALTYILSNTSSAWEVLPSVTRTMNFRALVRDNNIGDGCVAQESIAVNTNSSSGPFAVTSQNSTSSFTANGTNTMNVTWNVANTTATPVSAANVNIYFSTDNGQTFPYLLASGVTNNGTATVTVPNVNTSTGRIKVKAANNIFFDINNAPITVSSSCTANGSTFSPSSDVTAQQGNAALNLSLSPNYGTPLTISGTLASTDPTGTLAVVNGSGSSCTNFSNQFQYDLYTFQVNVAGSYTFTASGTTPFGTMLNLYENSFSATNPCNNFVTSSGVFNGTSVALGNSVTAILNPGITYILAIGTFDNTLPALPASYSVNVTAPGGGNIYNGSPNPGATFSYKYVIVDNATGNIVAITATPDLTAYAFGTYTVYGLSVSNSVTQPTLNTYAGGSFTSFQSALLNSTICGNLSTNSIVVTVTNPLHLTNLKLSATASGAGTRLTWIATGEEQTQSYLVERSINGREFAAIGNIPATHKGTYSFNDQAPLPGANYYRVQGTELGGAVLYSNVASVNFRTLASGEALIFPNPATGKTTVRLPEEGIYTCVLTDVSGQTVQSFNTETSEFTIDLTSLAPGIYFLRCNSQNERVVSRIIKQ